MVEVYLGLDDPKAAEIILAKAHRRLHKDEKALSEIKSARQRVVDYLRKKSEEAED